VVEAHEAKQRTVLASDFILGDGVEITHTKQVDLVAQKAVYGILDAVLYFTPTENP
jgi:hypothetical protein